MFTYKAEVVSVYDGDTITCDIDLGFGIIMRKQKIRLYGINTPEIRGSQRPDGLRSRLALTDMLDRAGYTITLRTIRDGKGKFGRWLGVVFINSFDGDGTDHEINVNDWLVDNGYAQRYEP